MQEVTLVKWAEMTTEERNQLIAEKVMGWRKCSLVNGTLYGELAPTRGFMPVPSYTTDIRAAWQIVEKFEQSNYHWHMSNNLFGEVDFYMGRAGHGRSKSAPEAICAAALAAVGVLIA